MPIPKKHLRVLNRHLRNAIVEGTVEGGAYALRISVPNLDLNSQHNVQKALDAAVEELRASGETVPRIKWGPTTMLPTK